MALFEPVEPTAAAGALEVAGAESRAVFLEAGVLASAVLFAGFWIGRRSRLRTRCTLLSEHGIPFSVAFATTSVAGMSAGSERMNSVSGDRGRLTVRDLTATRPGEAVVASGSGLADTGADGPTS